MVVGRSVSVLSSCMNECVAASGWHCKTESRVRHYAVTMVVVFTVADTS